MLDVLCQFMESVHYDTVVFDDNSIQQRIDVHGKLQIDLPCILLYDLIYKH